MLKKAPSSSYPKGPGVNKIMISLLLFKETDCQK